MTFVDVVFPAFLFIVGMSIPLSIGVRLERGGQPWKTLLHVLTRTIGLLILGVLMVNMDDERTGWPRGLWAALVYIAAIAAWWSPPAARGRPLTAILVRVFGAAALAYLAWAYVGPKGRWLQHSWWGILGLIGWAYLVVSLIYVPLRRNQAALVGATALLVALYVADKGGMFDGTGVGGWVDVGGALGTHAAVTMAGAVLGNALLLFPTMPPSRRMIGATLFGVALAVGAILLDPLYGINKIAATPGWALWSAAITAWLWVPLFAIIDVRGWHRWAAPLRGLGRNALLAYLLHPLLLTLMWLFGLSFYDRLGESAAVGVARSLTTATLLMFLAGWLYRVGLRLRL
jgi:predicted acyltransferase